MIRKVLVWLAVSLAAALVVIGANPDTAHAGPKPTTVTYSYVNETVTGGDGIAVQRNFIGQVSNGTANCTYGKYRPGSFISDPDGQFVGTYTGLTTGREDVRLFCIAHYADRTV
jgi:hypothetical protein